MNFFGNMFGGRKKDDNDCVCTIVWIILLLSICGGNCIEFDCTTILILILLLSCSNNCYGDMGGCRG